MKIFCEECGKEYEVILWKNNNGNSFIICSNCDFKLDISREISRILEKFINEERWNKGKIKRLENEVSILREKTKINYSVFRE